MTRLLLVLALLAALFASCDGAAPSWPEVQLPETGEENEPDVPGGDDRGADVEVFASGFENGAAADANGWDTVRLQTGPGRPDSVWSVSHEVANNGEASASFTAWPGTEDREYTCGKDSVIKAGLPVGVGDLVEYHVAVLLREPFVPVHLVDVECSGGCGLKGGPGVRLILTADRHPRINWKFRNWMEANGIPVPPELREDPPKGVHELPVGEWVEVVVRMELAGDESGVTEVYVNGELDLRVEGPNIAPPGMPQLDRYPQLEVGVNCNKVGNPGPATVHVDEARVLLVEEGAQRQ